MSRPQNKTPWETAERQIIAALDVRTAYRELGVVFAGGEPSAEGWLACRAAGRDDRNPSAAVNLRTGRYRDLGGEGLSLSLWDAAATFGPYSDWKAARAHFAEVAGVPLPDTKPPIDPTEHLAFQPWNPALVALWCLTKPGVAPEAVQAFGGRLARYRDQYTVIAFPVIGEGGVDNDPVGWVVAQTNGEPLPVFGKGERAAIRWVKIKTVSGSKAGFIGAPTSKIFDRTTTLGTIWKVEGPTDALALWAAIPADLRREQIVLTNASGASEHPQPWMAALFHGRRLAVIGDADEPGEIGALRWAKFFAPAATDVRIVKLPYVVTPDHGKDLRDWLNEAHAFAELQALHDCATPLHAPAAPAGGPKLDPGDLDAACEAETFLAARSQDGLPCLRFWRGSFHEWIFGAYRDVSPSEISARATQHLSAGYRRITSYHVNNTLLHLRGQTLLAGHTEPPCWLTEPPDGWLPTDVICSRSGLVHLPSAAEDCECIRPLTPAFFTPVALPFAFAPDAPRPDAWLQFLDQLWPEDPESIIALQEWFGYCLTPDTRQQKMLLLIGPRRSGKGTIGRTLRQVIGFGNSCGPTLASLVSNFGLQPLLGKTLAVISDARVGSRSDAAAIVERLLAISGEDPLNVDRKYQESVHGKLLTRVVILSNELPRLADSASALASRFILLRLTRSWLGHEDFGLQQTIDGELAGILLWAIGGWAGLQKRGRLLQPESSRDVIMQLEDLSSPVGQFIRERCVVDPAQEIVRRDLYSAYCEWSQTRGRKKIEDESGFGRNLRAVLPDVLTIEHRFSGEKVRFYRGVTLTPTWGGAGGAGN